MAVDKNNEIRIILVVPDRRLKDEIIKEFNKKHFVFTEGSGTDEVPSKIIVILGELVHYFFNGKQVEKDEFLDLILKERRTG